MTATYDDYTGNNSNKNFTYNFPALLSTDVKVSVDGVTQTSGYTVNTANTRVEFTTAPALNAKVRVYRDTAVGKTSGDEDPKAVFAAGSSVRAADLNNNFEQLLFAAHERQEQLILAEDIDTDSVTTVKIKDNAVTTAKIADSAISSAKIADGNITTAKISDSQVTTAKLAAGAVTTAKISDGNVTTAKLAADAITPAQIADDAIGTEHIETDGVRTDNIQASAVTTAKIADSNVTTAKLADSAVTSAKIANATIVTADIADGQITQAKLANNNVVNTAQLIDSSVTSAKIANATILTADIADGQITQAKLANNDVVNTAQIIDDAVTTAKIAADAITAAKVADDAIGHDQLIDNSIHYHHIADSAVTTAKIDDNAVTSGKIANATILTADIADGQITQAKLANNNVVNTDQIIDSAVTSAKIANATILTADIADGQITQAKLANNDVINTAQIQDNAVTTAKIADAELTTLAGMQSGTASILASGTALTSTTAELNLLDGKSIVTSVSGSSTDVQLPTAKAVNDQIVNLLNEAGGFVPIANEVSFPNANPDPNDGTGTIVSIADAGGVVVNGSGVSTTGRTLGGATVTINGIDSSLYNSTIAAGKGMLVQTTSTLNTYTYHRLVVDEAGVATAQSLVTSFNERYRVGSSNPTSSLDDGDLFFNTSSDKMLVYNATSSAWEEVQSVGNYFINTISSYSGTGGNSASFNGSAYRFVLSNPGANAEQHLVSVNGVVQKPNSGTSQPGEGFAIDGSSIIFSAAPASGSDFFIITIGASVNIGTPSNNTVSTAIIQNGAVTTDKLGADAVTGAKIADDTIDSEHYAAGSIDAEHIAASAINDGKISNGAVITAKIADDAVTADKLANAINTDIAAKMPLAGGTFTGDVTINMANGSAVIADNSENYLFFGDNVKSVFGNSADLQIYHDGSNSYLVDGGTGNLFIRAAAALQVQGANGENMIYANQDGSVELYHNAVKKLETTSAGVTILGDLNLDNQINAGRDVYWDESADRLSFSDDTHATFGNGEDLRIFHDGSNSRIKDTGTGALKLSGSGVHIENAAANETLARFYEDGASELYYDNVKKLETKSDGVEIHGHLYLENDEILKLGSGGGKTFFWHNGTNLTLRNYTGNFIVEAKSNEKAIQVIPDGAVELYYDNSKKFETTSGGVEVTGTLDADQVDCDGLFHLQYASSTNTNYMSSMSNNNGIMHLFRGDGLYIGDNMNTSNQAGGPNNQKIILKTNGTVKVVDDAKLVAGDSDDLQIYHDGTHSYIKNTGGNVVIQGNGTNSIVLQSVVGENAIVCNANNNVELYYNNVKTFETGTSGYCHLLGSNDPRLTIGDEGDEGTNNSNWLRGQAGNLMYNSGSGEHRWETAGTQRLVLSSSGTLSGDLNDTSDEKRKKNITSIPDGAIANIKQLRPVTFNWNDPTNTDKKSGFIAQEVKTVIPDLVVGEEYHEINNRLGYAINTSGVVAHLTKALQEAITKIETLETKVAALEAK